MRRYVILTLIALALTLTLAVPTQRPAYAQDESANKPTGKIAFASTRSGHYQIYVMNADSSNIVQVTWDSADNFGPLLSPDGQKILYSSGNISGGIYGFKIIDVTGLHPVVIDQSGEIAAARPQWSPDSKRLLFGLLRNDIKSIDFYVVNADGTNRVKLYYLRPKGVPQAQWISNSEIALTTEDGLEEMAPESTNMEMVIPDRSGSFAFGYLMLALESDYVSSVNGSMKTVVTDKGDGASTLARFALPANSILYHLEWSPDGLFLGVDVRTLDPKSDLNGYYIFNTTTNVFWRASSDYWAVWSPDSNYIASTGSDKQGYAQVYIVGMAPGSQPYPITSGDFYSAQPSWSVGSVTEAVY